MPFFVPPPSARCRGGGRGPGLQTEDARPRSRAGIGREVSAARLGSAGGLRAAAVPAWGGKRWGAVSGTPPGGCPSPEVQSAALEPCSGAKRNSPGVAFFRPFLPQSHFQVPCAGCREEEEEEDGGLRVSRDGEMRVLTALAKERSEQNALIAIPPETTAGLLWWC